MVTSDVIIVCLTNEVDIAMNHKSDGEVRAAFRDWLREKLQNLDFYNRRCDHYLIREFHRYCAELGQESTRQQWAATYGPRIRSSLRRSVAGHWLLSST